MRKLLNLIILIFVIFGFSACQVGLNQIDDDTGTIRITVPLADENRGIGDSFESETDNIRVYATLNGISYDLDEESDNMFLNMESRVFEVELGVGPEYQLLFTLGTITNGEFSSSPYYAESESFRITQGVTKTVDVNVYNSPFTRIETSTVDDVVVFENDKYQILDNNLYINGTKADKFYNDEKYYSLSKGDFWQTNSSGSSLVPVVLFNTDYGVIPYNSTNGKLTDALGRPGTEKLGKISISGTIVWPNGSLILYIQGDEGMPRSATITPENGEAGDYSNLEWNGASELKETQPDVYNSLMGMLKAGEDVMYDQAEIDGNYLVASAINMFILGPDGVKSFTEIFTGGSGFSLASILENPNLLAVSTKDNNDKTVRTYSVNYASKLLYFGTQKGVYTLDYSIKSDGNISLGSTASRITGTAKSKITQILTISDDKQVFLADDRFFTKNGSDIEEYPMYKGLPGKLNRVTYDSSAGELIIAGDAGLVTLQF